MSASWRVTVWVGPPLVILVALGIVLFRKASVYQEYRKEKQKYEKRAAAADPDAMTDLATLSALGHGVPQDYRRAAELLEKAAEAGDRRAMADLGYLFEHGEGVPQDYSKAREWYEKAALAGDVIAMNNLGSLYEQGHGVPRDYEKAGEWYEEAEHPQPRLPFRTTASPAGNPAELPDPGSKDRQDPSCCSIASSGCLPVPLLRAVEVQRNTVAFLVTAMNKVGNLYFLGQGVPQDYQQAKQWYEKAAAAGNVSAMRSLGYMYEQGEGVPQDDRKAKEWYDKADGTR